ncbi:hypothetical protein [Stenotrophomonas maltophilia]|uniref:hypothetical protein n=1 Tax=Stenotrophomonas maltophilia TaxID=40324 RepID=UPI0028EA98E8|nr:hypothetical protein [Stenotrophomonas maltophilia]WNV14506.1 hypothetical protein RS400_20505 [Stenotrophomonas maltophilia]
MADRQRISALSAQPSPGGQGDALASLPLYRLADDANGNRGLHRDDTGSWVKLQDVERALAAHQPVASNQLSGNSGELDVDGARQPVGEPVAVRVTPEMRAAFRKAYREGGFWADRLDTALDAMMRAAPPAQPVGEPVAYLDLGAGGYMDVGTDLSDEELAVLPKGRHMLGIIGTYGVDGYKPAQAVDLGQIIEQIAQQWDGCSYDAVGETIDVGQAIRAAGKRLLDRKAAANG